MVIGSDPIKVFEPTLAPRPTVNFRENVREQDPTRPFGDRRAELLAAAQVLRVWLHERRAEWSDGRPLDLTLGASRVDVSAPAARASFETAAALPAPDGFAEPGTSRDARAILGRVWSGVTAAAAVVLSALAALRGPLGRLLGQLWRAALAAVRLVVAAVSRGMPAVGERVGSLQQPATEWGGRVIAVTSVVAIIGTIGWAGFRYWPALKQRGAAMLESSPVPEAEAPAAAADEVPVAGAGRGGAAGMGRIRVESDPPGAKVVLGGRDRGPTPLTIDGLRPGSYTVVLESPKGAVSRTVTVRADRTTTISESIYAGWLHVSSPIELQISRGGRELRLDERNQLLLAPGSHELRFENKSLAFAEVRQVVIEPGKTATLSVAPQPSVLTVTATIPAVVLVDGAPVGQTPLNDYRINLGTHEITVRSDTGMERRQTVTVTTAPLRVDVDLGPPQ
jgi:hypothetical protein